VQQLLTTNVQTHSNSVEYFGESDLCVGCKPEPIAGGVKGLPRLENVRGSNPNRRKIVDVHGLDRLPREQLWRQTLVDQDLPFASTLGRGAADCRLTKMQRPRPAHAHGVEGEVQVCRLANGNEIAGDVTPRALDAQLARPEPLVNAKPTSELRDRKLVKRVAHIRFARPWPFGREGVEAQTFAELVEARQVELPQAQWAAQ
jgi:hypothetical protein